MQKRILLHIGTGKTGSTSIQKWLSDAQDKGSMPKVAYPLWDHSHNQQRLITLYKPYDELPLPMRESYGPAGKHYDRVRAEYRKFIFKRLHAAQHAIVSGESLCGLLSTSLIRRLRADLEAVGFHEFCIVLYVREPAAFYLAGVQDTLKMASDPPFIWDVAEFRYQFLAWAQAWEEVFPGKLLVRKFLPANQNDVIKDFSAVLEDYFDTTVPWVPMEMNASLSTEGMQILQDYRETFTPNGGILTPDTRKLIRFLEQSKQQFAQTKPVLKREIVTQIQANHMDDANRLHALYGIDLFPLNDKPPILLKERIDPYRVSDVVEFIDPKIVQRLLLQAARAEFMRPRALHLRIAYRIYRVIPKLLKLKRLETWLRKRYLSPWP